MGYTDEQKAKIAAAGAKGQKLLEGGDPDPGEVQNVLREINAVDPSLLREALKHGQ
jgi:hypothetical protein